MDELVECRMLWGKKRVASEEGRARAVAPPLIGLHLLTMVLLHEQRATAADHIHHDVRLEAVPVGRPQLPLDVQLRAARLLRGWVPLRPGCKREERPLRGSEVCQDCRAGSSFRSCKSLGVGVCERRRARRGAPCGDNHVLDLSCSTVDVVVAVVVVSLSLSGRLELLRRSSTTGPL